MSVSVYKELGFVRLEKLPDELKSFEELLRGRRGMAEAGELSDWPEDQQEVAIQEFLRRRSGGRSRG